MLDFFAQLFTHDGFMPHGHCYLWKSEIVGLHVTSDALIGLAYTSIPFTLAYFVRARHDLPYRWMFYLFGLFIVACGATHFMSIWTLWTPDYRASGVLKAITAVASVATAGLLIRLVPEALSIPSPEDLRVVNDRLREAQQDLEHTNQQLASTNAELEAFSYSVAHDLRAPLRAMSGFAEILLSDSSDKLDEDELDCLSEITRNAARMSALIDGLLGLSRVTRSSLRVQPVDVSTMAERILWELAIQDPHRKVEVTVQPGVTATADPDLLLVVLENLLGNAWKFTERTAVPRIEVGASEADGGVVYFVKDNGAGFDAQYAQRMFSAFQRFHSQAEFSGTGIGLATVKRVVHRHGGNVWADGEVGQGATFYFTLNTQRNAGDGHEGEDSAG